MKWMLEVNDRAGICSNINFNALLVDTIGAKNFSFQHRDHRNFIKKVKRLGLGARDVFVFKNIF